jgi:hypothetical protein
MRPEQSSESRWRQPSPLQIGAFAVAGSIAGENLAESLHIYDTIGKAVIGSAVAGIASLGAFVRPRSGQQR